MSVSVDCPICGKTSEVLPDMVEGWLCGECADDMQEGFEGEAEGDDFEDHYN